MKSKRFLKITEIIICISVIVLLIAAIVPLLYIAAYSHPSADDYTYGAAAHFLYTNGGGFNEIVKGAFDTVKGYYNSWQGTYSGMFLMALTPAAFEGTVSYAVTAYIMIFSLIISVFFVSYFLVCKLYNAGMASWLTVSGALCFLIIETIYSPVDGIFWFNGSIHYVFMQSMMFICITFAALVSLYSIKEEHTPRRILSLIAACIFGFIFEGGNYSTALIGIVLIGCILFAEIIIRRKPSLNIITFIVCLICLIVSMKAPGNSVRQGNFEGLSPFVSIIESFKVVFMFAKQFNIGQTLIIILFLAPTAVIIGRKAKGSFSYPLPALVTAFSIAVLASMNVPLFYAMGGAGVPRQVNILKITYQILLIFNVIYWIGYLIRIGIGDKLKINPVIAVSVIYVLTIAFSLAHFKTDDTVLKDYSSYAAYVSISAGEAEAYKNEYNERLRILSLGSDEIGLEPFTVQPYLLYQSDIATDWQDWTNTAFASWTGKKKVFLTK